jgi:hypothetical protein
MGMSQLIAEVTALTATVRDKDKAISSAVAAAVAAAPTMERIFYVDAVLGLDTAAGTAAAPFKTVKRAVEAIPYGGGGFIYLEGGQDHDIGSINLIWRHVVMATKTGASARARIANRCFTATSSDSSSAVNNSTTGFQISHAYLGLNNLTIRTADYSTPDSTFNNTYQGFIRRNDRPGGFVQVSQCDIQLGDTPFLRQTFNGQAITLSLYTVNVTRVGPVEKSMALLESNGVPLTLMASSVTFPAGAKWMGDMLRGVIRDANGVNFSLVSNFIPT